MFSDPLNDLSCRREKGPDVTFKQQSPRSVYAAMQSDQGHLCLSMYSTVLSESVSGNKDPDQTTKINLDLLCVHV